MIPLCLTRRSGTLWWGLYRGLKLKTDGTPWDVRFIRCSLDEVLNRAHGPLILSVRLDDGPGVDPRYKNDWGWIPGVQHSVVYFQRKNENSVEMGDPANGRELWGVGSLKTLWHGDALEMVPRAP